MEHTPAGPQPDPTAPSRPLGPPPTEPQPPPEVSPPRWGPWRLGLVGAVLIVLVGSALIAVSLSGGDERGATPRAGTPSATPTPAPSIGGPVDMLAKAKSFRVTLTWTAPTGQVAPTGYRIYRDGKLLGSVLATTTRYVDDQVVPGKRYRYEVETLSGTVTSDRASASVRTLVPPLSDARVEGNFTFDLDPSSQSGFVETLSNFAVGWNFRPKCGRGACTVVWKDVNQKELTGTLERGGEAYTGSDSGPFHGRCGGTTVTSTLTIELRVKKAKAFDGEWVATKLVGTLREYSPASLGCVSSSATYHITGTLLR